MTRDEEIAMIARKWAGVRPLLPPEAVVAIEAVHRELQFDCCGYNEGQSCCLDNLLFGSAG